MELAEFFKVNNKAALAFSGGVDSAYLLFAAVRCGADIRPYFVKSQFQPEFEFDDAMRLAEQLSVPLTVIDMDVLSIPEVCRNQADRCYHCKRSIMSAIIRAARDDGYTLLLDGTNASDDTVDRPGMRAISELNVCSPLRECGLTKAAIRQLSKAAGLFTWDKPAYACLATRVAQGERLTQARLERVEKCESILYNLGFTDLRVRTRGNTALLQFTLDELPHAMSRQGEIFSLLSPYFDEIRIDEEGRKRT